MSSVEAWPFSRSITAGSAEGVAQSLADAEGLTLIRACNQSGYRYVTVDPRKLHVNTGSLVRTPYRARSTGQHKFNLGEFATAHEAALAVARFFGPQLSRDQAAATREGSRRGRESEFGVPKKRSLDAAYCVDTYHPLAYCTHQGTGQLAPGPHAMYVRRTRASLGRDVRTSYRGTPGGLRPSSDRDRVHRDDRDRGGDERRRRQRRLGLGRADRHPRGGCSGGGRRHRVASWRLY